VFGQMVDVLWQQGKHDAAIRLELLWNQFAQTQASSAVCAYAIGNFYKDAGFEDVGGQQTQYVWSDATVNPTAAEASDMSRGASKRNRRG
jgi:hypothetical protein